MVSKRRPSAGAPSAAAAGGDVDVDIRGRADHRPGIGDKLLTGPEVDKRSREQPSF
jgi:hypothetical protein